MNDINLDEIQLQNLLKNAEPIPCKVCNNNYYKQVVVMQRISKLITATPRDTVVPQQAFMCDACGTPFGMGYEEETKNPEDNKKDNLIKF